MSEVKPMPSFTEDGEDLDQRIYGTIRHDVIACVVKIGQDLIGRIAGIADQYNPDCRAANPGQSEDDDGKRYRDLSINLADLDQLFEELEAAVGLSALLRKYQYKQGETIAECIERMSLKDAGCAREFFASGPEVPGIQ